MERYVLEGNISVKAAVLGGVRPVYEILVDEQKKDRDTTWILYRAKERGIPIRRCPRSMIDALAQGHTHGGLLCFCGERTCQTLSQVAVEGDEFFALVEGVEDPFNFASLLRTLYASGCQGILSPERNWQTATGILVKASAGASEYLPWISYGSPQEILDQLQEQRLPLLCAERKDSVSLYDYTFPARFCIAIGGEMRGLSKAIKAASVQNICIPYGREVRNALNAESATAVIAFEILRQRLSGNPG